MSSPGFRQELATNPRVQISPGSVRSSPTRTEPGTRQKIARDLAGSRHEPDSHEPILDLDVDLDLDLDLVI